MIVRHARLALAAVLAVALVACGGSPSASDETESADVSSAAKGTTLPSGHYVNVTSDQEINAAYWIEDVHVASNGTFTGVIGCGLSDCSGHQFPITEGHWIFHNGGEQIDLSYHYDDGRLFQDDHFDFRTGKNGAIQLRSQDEDGAGWFTLDKE